MNESSQRGSRPETHNMRVTCWSSRITRTAVKLVRLHFRQGPHCTDKIRKIVPKKIPVREFGNFAKRRGILFAQVVKSLFLQIQDIAIFAAKFPNFSKLVLHIKLSLIPEIDTGKISSLTGKTHGIWQ